MDELNLSTIASQYSDEDAAQAFFKNIRWPNGAACVHCGSLKVYALTPKEGSTKSRKALKLWKCGDCKGQFTVTVGTIFEDSHIPLHKWLLAFHLLCSSKKGMSSHQLHRMLGVSYKSAWFMTHRIRYAMSQPSADQLQGIVESYFSILQRGIEGVYHHVSEKHLHRYLAEFDFRYNERKVEDGVRTVKAIQGAEGKRLMLR